MDINSLKPLPRSFYYGDTVKTARSLLGKILVHNSKDGITAGLITETEAYTGLNDPASHSFNRNSRRVSIQYKDSGLVYIFLIYGIYYCFNITTGDKSSPEVVLVRAIEPLYGIELMKFRRNKNNTENLTDGPGKLTIAMGIDMSHYGIDLTGTKLFISHPIQKRDFDIKVTKRINIDYAGFAKDLPYRFLIEK